MAARLGAQKIQRAQHQIVGICAQSFGKFANYGQAVRICGDRRQFIASIDKGEQRLDVMIAIGSPRAHVEREVDLGIGGFAPRRHGASVASVSPPAILAASRSVIAGSAPSAAARQA